MQITCDKDTLIVSDLKDFNIEQTMECGQCFHFEKIGEQEYGIVSLDKFIHIKQIEDTLYCKNTDENEFKEYWINYFDLNRDYGKIKKYLIDKDRKLQSVIEDKYGVRILNQEFEETLMSFIISQNKQIPHIKKIVKDISRIHGKRLGEIGDFEFFSFPDREVLMNITQEQYGECKTGFRAKYLADASLKLKQNLVNKEMFRNMSYNEAKELLISIKGVGEKVANCVLLFGLGYREAFPVDVWIKRIMENLYFEKETSNEEIMKFAKERFGIYGGYAQQYLFYYGRENQIGK